jgi:predicted transcriptional regulator
VAGQRSRPRGQLEQAVLDALWLAEGAANGAADGADHGAALTARQILDTFPEPHPALTTVLTVLERLGRKGAVVREERPDAPLAFRAVHSRAEAAATLMRSALAATTDREAALLQFTGSLGADDLDALRRAIGASGAGPRTTAD